jgi:hypothetical protein
MASADEFEEKNNVEEYKHITKHMWNIIRMDDGKNYIADLTNCDPTRGNGLGPAAGYPDRLFLKGAGSGSVIDGYDYLSLHYSYYTDYERDPDDASKIIRTGASLDLFSEDELTMSYSDYECHNADPAPKKKNTLTVRGKTACIWRYWIRHGRQTISRKDALYVSKARGDVSYKKISGNRKISVDRKTGNIKIAKSLRGGTYKIRVRVRAAGNTRYRAMSKTVTVRIRVRYN